MSKHLSLLFAFCFFALVAFAQADSTREQILKYEDGKAELINKGRKMIFDYVSAANKDKVQEVMDYLGRQEGTSYVSFYPIEKCMLNYWLHRYDSVLVYIAYFDSVYTDQYNTRIEPQRDNLYAKLKMELQEKKASLVADIQASKLGARDKSMLCLNLDYTLYTVRAKGRNYDSMQHNADKFLQSYPQSPYDKFVRKYIPNKYQLSDWAFGVDLGIGGGLYSGELSNVFANNTLLGMDLDLFYKKYSLFLGGMVGTSSTKADLYFPTVVWPKESRAQVSWLEASVAYACIDKYRLRISPIAGISVFKVAAFYDDIKNNPAYNDVSTDVINYIAGLSCDMQLGRTRHEPIGFRMADSHFFLRLRYGYNMPQLSGTHIAYGGNFHAFTIGIGYMSRPRKAIR